MVIHADAADEGTLAVRVAECCESVGGRDMDSCEVRCACCAVGKRAGDDMVIDAQALRGRVFRISVLVLWV